jgi:hypothetical protein
MWACVAPSNFRASVSSSCPFDASRTIWCTGQYLIGRTTDRSYEREAIRRVHISLYLRSCGDN